MKILATFDGSKSAEVILPQLEWMAQLPDTHFTFLSIAHRPHETAKAGQPPREIAGFDGIGGTAVIVPSVHPVLVENRGEAIDRKLAERSAYLHRIVARMPVGPEYAVEAMIANDVTGAIVRYAMQHQPDVIVMGTHGENGMIHRLFGDTAEGVVRAGVAPVLLVHSEAVHRVRKT